MFAKSGIPGGIFGFWGTKKVARSLYILHKKQAVFFLSSPGEWQHDLDGEQLSAGLCRHGATVFLHDTAGNLQLIAVAASVVWLAAGQRRADDVDDREALPPAYKQVDHAAVILLLGCSVDGLVEQVLEQRVQGTRLDGRKAGAIGHAVQADALGLTQQALFGQDDV